ncbi:WhiB family transcriptional regulator [Streptomyces sp. URMC 129]|uniref:WhiB family transcriptional regulator n=1 Tax=Streptomyces sp. URMC 129 TaxID=3423407 RepID=UPI003F1A6D7C
MELPDISRPWRRHPWRACRSEPTDLFFPPIPGEPVTVTTARAKAVCEGCPVLEQCRRDTLGEPYGIWGGRDEEERRTARRRLAGRVSKADAAERLAWGRLAYESYQIDPSWTRTQHRLGLGASTAKKLAGEYEQTLPTEEAEAPPPGGPKLLKPNWPRRRGQKHAWAFYLGHMNDVFLLAQDVSGEFFRVQIDTKRSGAQPWIPVSDLRIYSPQVLPVQPRKEKHRYGQRRPAV